MSALGPGVGQKLKNLPWPMQVMLMPGPLCSEVVRALRKSQRLSIVSGVIRGAPMSVSIIDTHVPNSSTN